MCLARAGLLAAVLLAGAGFTRAQAPEPPQVAPALGSPVTLMALDWQNLTTEQKRLLEPLSAEWNSLEAASRVRWMELTARYPSLSSEEQQRLEERIAQWAKLSPTERQAVRLSFQQARQIKPEDRAAKWEAYQALPQERRDELADRAAKKHKPAAAAHPASASAATAHGGGAVATPLPAPGAPAPGPTLMQAKPGATTVQFSARSKPAPSTIQRRFYAGARVDAATLLVKPEAGTPVTQGKPSSE
jgi:hypothetical protein